MKNVDDLLIEMARRIDSIEPKQVAITIALRALIQTHPNQQALQDLMDALLRKSSTGTGHSGRHATVREQLQSFLACAPSRPDTPQ